MAHEDDSDAPKGPRTQTVPDGAQRRFFEPPTAKVAQDKSPLGAFSTINHYEIIRKLGQGGMGAVFLARDTKLGRLVAIKVLLEHSGPRAGRFLIEARATARCKHENIVVIYEVNETERIPYMGL